MFNPMTSAMLCHPVLPRSHSAASTAPSANPWRDLASWRSVSISTSLSHRTSCMPGTSPSRIDVMGTFPTHSPLRRVLSPSFEKRAGEMSSASVLAVPDGASSLCTWCTSVIDGVYPPARCNNCARYLLTANKMFTPTL